MTNCVEASSSYIAKHLVCCKLPRVILRVRGWYHNLEGNPPPILTGIILASKGSAIKLCLMNGPCTYSESSHRLIFHFSSGATIPHVGCVVLAFIPLIGISGRAKRGWEWGDSDILLVSFIAQTIQIMYLGYFT